MTDIDNLGIGKVMDLAWNIWRAIHCICSMALTAWILCWHQLQVRQYVVDWPNRKLIL
jgi:hypothetical protein